MITNEVNDSLGERHDQQDDFVVIANCISDADAIAIVRALRNHER